jgi:lipopolysaccharide biosynthesis glycosyltransferase
VTLHVACAAEGFEYVGHSAAMLHSLLSQHPRGEVAIHYMHGPDIGAREEELLAEMVEREGGSISFLRIEDSELEGLPTVGFTRKATWYRIFLPDLRAELERIVYLDADLLVLDSLEPLWQTDLEGQWLGAVTNVLQHNHAHRPAQLGIEEPHVYFNAGVLLMNLEQMRRDGRTEALLDYAREDPDRIEWRDQDALNVVLGPRRVRLHPRFNYMNSFAWEHAAEAFGADALEEARAHPAIRHFEGPDLNKPWHYMCEHDLKQLYEQHRRATPWPRYRPDGRTPRNVVRKRLARRRAATVA